MKTTLMALAMTLAMFASPAFADLSYPVASGPTISAPGDEGVAGHNPTAIAGKPGHPRVRNG